MVLTLNIETNSAKGNAFLLVMVELPYYCFVFGVSAFEGRYGVNSFGIHSQETLFFPFSIYISTFIKRYRKIQKQK